MSGFSGFNSNYASYHNDKSMPRASMSNPMPILPSNTIPRENRLAGNLNIPRGRHYNRQMRNLGKYGNLGQPKDDYIDKPRFGPYPENNFLNVSQPRSNNSHVEWMAKRMNIIPDRLMKEFFGRENINRIQKKIRKEIFTRSGGKFKMQVNQNEDKLVEVMKSIYEAHASNLPTGIVRQTKCLNNHVVHSLVPSMMSMIKQHYGYLRDISQPLQPMDRPVNVNRAGRNTLPSLTSVWEL